MADKRYYWLKLKKDFFKRHDIKIIEAMPNGKDYILFYLKLLVESVDHNGGLRFNDTVPYDENMLSVITSTDVDKVRSAMKIFTGLKMIEVMEDRTIFMTEVEKMLGSETYWAEQKRIQRERDEIKEIGQSPEFVQSMSNLSKQEIELDIDKEKELDKDKKTYKYSSSQMLLAEKLKSLILANNPNAKVPKKLDRWANDIRLMVEGDKRIEDDVGKVLEWSQNDSFWQANILSASKLRKQYDTLYMQMNRNKPAGSSPIPWEKPRPTPDPDCKACKGTGKVKVTSLGEVVEYTCDCVTKKMNQ